VFEQGLRETISAGRRHPATSPAPGAQSPRAVLPARVPRGSATPEAHLPQAWRLPEAARTPRGPEVRAAPARALERRAAVVLVLPAAVPAVVRALPALPSPVLAAARRL
jgi:hypothetical protein